MKRILMSLAAIVFLGGAVAGGTGAFFSDEEMSTGNVFAAGELDLRVDSVAHINGLVCFQGAWTPDDQVVWNGTAEALELAQGADVSSANTAYNTANPANVPRAGDVCGGTWTLTDLGPEHTFFDYRDLKPGDNGENTISLHVSDNDSYMCAAIHHVESKDNGCNEPEADSPDTTCDDVNPDEGELDQELSFRIWEDDGDNVWEQDERVLVENASGENIADVHELYTPATGVFEGGSTQYLGVAWCYGTFNADGTCDGAPVTNLSQSDSLTADITFYVEQARNNAGFKCPDIGDFDGGDNGGIGCTEDTDVMFVLDSSGSIDTTELGVMQTAATAFATALSPSTPGTHIGVVDFDGDATLEQELTDVLADINNAIAALSSGGSTNLADGILVASTELAGANDRPDGASPDYMVILTDGDPDSPTAAADAATAAKAAGTTVYVVGIGDGVNDVYLKDEIATSPAHYFSAAEFGDLEILLQDLADCDGGQPPAAPLVGAALATYDDPETAVCSDTVDGGESLQTAIDAAAPGATICVDPTYTGAGDAATVIEVNEANLTIAGLGVSGAATVGKGLHIDADGVTIKGLTLNTHPLIESSEQAAIYVNSALTGVTITHNKIVPTDDAKAANAKGIITEIGNSGTAGVSGLTVSHNLIQGWNQGIFLNTANAVVSFNDILDNNVGVANDGPHNTSIHHNDFEDNDSEAVGVAQSATNGTTNNGVITINTNNFTPAGIGNDVNQYLADGLVVDATNNWWDGEAEASRTNDIAQIDTEPAAVAVFPEN